MTTSIPLVTRNESNHVVFISDDPNWDDQILIVDGKELGGGTYPLAPGDSADITTNLIQEAPDENGIELGVIFADNDNFDIEGRGYQEWVGQDPETGLMSLRRADEAEIGHPRFKLGVLSQSRSTLRLAFLDR